MKKEDIFDALNGVDPEYIAASAPKGVKAPCERRFPLFKTVAAVAAAAVLFGAVALVIANRSPEPAPPPAISEESSAVSVSSEEPSETPESGEPSAADPESSSEETGEPSETSGQESGAGVRDGDGNSKDETSAIFVSADESSESESLEESVTAGGDVSEGLECDSDESDDIPNESETSSDPQEPGEAIWFNSFDEFRTFVGIVANASESEFDDYMQETKPALLFSYSTAERLVEHIRSFPLPVYKWKGTVGCRVIYADNLKRLSVNYNYDGYRVRFDYYFEYVQEEFGGDPVEQCVLDGYGFDLYKRQYNGNDTFYGQIGFGTSVLVITLNKLPSESLVLGDFTMEIIA